MKYRIGFIVVGVLLLVARLGQADTGTKGVIWQGTAANITVGVTSKVSLTLATDGEGSLTAIGNFDNRTLFGRFETTGRQLPQSPDGQETCLQFKGHLYLGDGDGSGFPQGTLTDFTLSLWVAEDGIIGIYHLGELFDRDYQQYGTLALRRHLPVPDHQDPDH
jgi:hypothetical protein